jgi:hypothetical protein
MTKMSEAELATMTAELPEVFAARLPPADLAGLRSMASGGEWEELLDLLVSALRHTGVPVAPGELNQLREVLSGWGLPTAELEKLVVR